MQGVEGKVWGTEAGGVCKAGGEGGQRQEAYARYEGE